MKIKITPVTVIKIVLYDELLLCASGKISAAPIYKRKPAKKPKYKTRIFCGIEKKKVDIAPKIGAVASSSKSPKAFFEVFL